MQVLLYMSRFACLLGDRNNTGLITGHMGKYFHELLQILVNWNENLKRDTDKDLSFLLRRLLAGILAQMGTSYMLGDEFEIALLDSSKQRCRLNLKRWFCFSFPYKVNLTYKNHR